MANKDRNPIDRHVGALIRMQRMVRGMSQTELGKAVGVTFQQYKNMKTARIASVPVGCNKSPTS